MTPKYNNTCIVNIVAVLKECINFVRLFFLCCVFLLPALTIKLKSHEEGEKKVNQMKMKSLELQLTTRSTYVRCASQTELPLFMVLLQQPRWLRSFTFIYSFIHSFVCSFISQLNASIVIAIIVLFSS